MRILIVCGRDPVCNVGLRAQAEEAVRQMRIVYPVMDMDASAVRQSATPDDILLMMCDTAQALGPDLPGRVVVIEDASRLDEVKGKLSGLMLQSPAA